LAASPPPQSSIADISSGSFWVTLSTLLNRIMVIVVAIPVVRILGKEAYGSYALVAKTLMLFATFGATGFGALGNRYIAELKVKDPQRVGRIVSLCVVTVLTLGSATFAAMFLLADWAATDVCKDASMAPLFRLAAVGLYGIALNGLSRGILGGFRAFTLITYSQAIGVISAPLLIGLGCYSFGLKGAVGGFALNHATMGLVATILALTQLKKFGIHFNFKESLREVRLLQQFWLPAMLGSMVVVPASWLVQVMVKRQEPNGDLLLGVCSAADQYRVALGIIPMAMGQVILTMLSECRADEDKTKYGALYDLNVRLTLLTVLPLSLIGVCAAKAIMAVFGPSFVPDWSVLAILSSAGLFAMIAATVGQLMTSGDRMWLALALNSMWMVAILFFGWILIPRSGANGFAWAHLLSYVLHAAISLYLVKVVFRLRLSRSSMTLLATIPVWLIASWFLAHHASLTLGIVAALFMSAASVAFCIIMGLSRDERSDLTRMASSLAARFR